MPNSFFLLLSLFTNPVPDTIEQADPPGVVFLSIPAGARETGMGSSGTGKCDDPAGIKYNPGAIGFFNNFQLAITNQGPPPGAGRFLEDAWLKSLSFLLYEETKNLTPEPPWLGWLIYGMRYIYGICVCPIKNYGIFGLNYLYFTTGLTDIIDPQGNYLGSFYSYDYAIGITHGKCIKRLGMGFTMKYVYSFLFPDWIEWAEGGSGHTVAFDFGIQYRLKGLNGGISLLNLGPRIKYGDRAWDRLPTRFNWGISIEPVVILDSILLKDKLLFENLKFHDIINIKYNLDRSHDFEYPDTDIWHGSGWEFKFFNYFSYRFGSFEWMGKSNGIGLNLGIYTIDVAKYYGDAYHVQLTINPALSNYATDDYTKRKVFTLSSLFIAPGSAQFYKGEGVKGSLFFIPGLI
ncbi:MAG: hypothetical protein ABIL40_02260, partial [candidate division WOR-3 bacterium]